MWNNVKGLLLCLLIGLVILALPMLTLIMVAIIVCSIFFFLFKEWGTYQEELNQTDSSKDNTEDV